MPKPIIAVDIDEVLVPHFVDLMAWYNTSFGTNLTERDNHPTDTTNWATNSIDEAVKRVHDFYRTSEFRNAKPFSGAVTALKKLAVSFEIIVITARDTPLEQLTNDWLAEHFKELIKAVHFTRYYSLEGKRRNKSDVLLDQSVDYFIDDSFISIEQAAAVGIECVLFGDYAWNQVKSLPTHVTRCVDWVAVEKHFAAIK